MFNLKLTALGEKELYGIVEKNSRAKAA